MDNRTRAETNEGRYKQQDNDETKLIEAHTGSDPADVVSLNV
jgi:hypothetical protein